MRLWRRKPFDPRKGASAGQQEISAQIDGKLAAEAAELRKEPTLDILVLGTYKAGARFVEDWERYIVQPRISQAAPTTGDERPSATGTCDERDRRVLDRESHDRGNDEQDRYDARSADDDMAELAGELHSMSAHATYKSDSQASRSVDLLAASYLVRAMRTADSWQHSIASRFAVNPDRNTIDNIAHHQTSVLHNDITLPLQPPRQGLQWIRFKVLGEQSLAHPKTFAFFLDFSNVIVFIDLNTLHEKHPDGQVTRAMWATHLAEPLHFRTCHRLVFYVFTGLGQFRATSADRSPADYLATWFDDFVPNEGMQRSNDPTHTENATLRYLFQRLSSSQTGDQQHYYSFLDSDDATRYRLFASHLLEVFIATPIHIMRCFGSA